MMTDSYTAPHETTDGDAKAATPHHTVPPRTAAPALTAVDDLAVVRAQIAALKSRESALCDEIRTCATDTGGERVAGLNVDAMIETRRPRRIDMSKLPVEIMSDPNMYRSDLATHVLIWPKARTLAAPEIMAHPDTPHDDSTQEPLRNLSDAHLCEAQPYETEDTRDDMPDEGAVHDTGPDAPCAPQPPVHAAAAEGDSHDNLAPPIEDACEVETSEDEVCEDVLSETDAVDTAHEQAPSEPLITISEEHDLRSPDTSARDIPPAQSDDHFAFAARGGNDTADDPAKDPTCDEITNIFAQEPSNAAYGPAPEDIDDSSPFLLTKAIARLTAKTTTPPAPASESPVTTPDTAAISHAVKGAIIEILERPAPRDLKPTGIAELQPLAGLHNEHVAAVLADAQAPLESAPMDFELEEAHALEARADALLARVDAGEEIDDLRAPSAPNPYGFESTEDYGSNVAAFASRRAANRDD
ncbi:hypothetical protein [Celeribacter sp.]|uniref:hypothetical protein n=1 Tax=Celeribacter sp. TaxID=1890673 RepID=UPI003A950C7D